MSHELDHPGPDTNCLYTHTCPGQTRSSRQWVPGRRSLRESRAVARGTPSRCAISSERRKDLPLLSPCIADCADRPCTDCRLSQTPFRRQRCRRSPRPWPQPCHRGSSGVVVVAATSRYKRRNTRTLSSGSWKSGRHDLPTRTASARRRRWHVRTLA